jgi:hypothetical protein
MMIVTPTQALIGIGSLAALLVIVYGPWQAICTDIARQILFEKRDAIFDLAESGKLSFASREYRVIRSSLQASIRYAHELTLPRFLVMAAVLSARGNRPEDNDLSRAITQIVDPTTRNQVEKLIKQAYRTLVIMMVAKSPVMILVLLPLLLIIAVILLPPFRDAASSVERRAGGFIQLEADTAPS